MPMEICTMRAMFVLVLQSYVYEFAIGCNFILFFTLLNIYQNKIIV